MVYVLCFTMRYMVFGVNEKNNVAKKWLFLVKNGKKLLFSLYIERLWPQNVCWN